MSKTYIFYIDGMTCINCSNGIKHCLRNKFGDKLQYFHVAITTADPKKTIVTLDNDEDTRAHQIIWSELKEEIEDIGFICREYEYSPEKIVKKTMQNELQKQAQQKLSLNSLITKTKSLLTSHWFLGAIGSIAGLAVLVACLVTGGSLAFMVPIAIFSTLATLALGANSYNQAWSKLTKTGILTMDSLFALSSLSILAVSIASLFVPWLPMMFEAGLLIYGFRHIGIAIEETIKEKISTARFQDRAPKIARKQVDLDVEEINLELIQINDVIVIHPGEIIPLDGICMNESSVYDTIITGATLPHYFSAEKKVLAGMRLAENSNPLKIRVTHTHTNSYLKRLDDSIERSVLEKAPIEIKTEQVLAYFIPTVIALAVLSGVIMGFFFPAAVAIQCAISVLASACPCTLGLITPLAVNTGMHKAAENGVQFKSAKTLQQAEQIDTVIFDLNGTLTTGVPKVKNLYLLDNSRLSEEEILSICETLEKKSSHPIGKAVYSFANQKSKQKLDVTELDETYHSGVSGVVLGDHYTIGSKALMREKGVSITSELKHPPLAAGDQLVYVARNQEIIGVMVLTDPLRTDAHHTINALKVMGKEIHLCTGADEETALRYAKALGIENVFANCIASSMENNHRSKTAYIHTLKKQGRKIAMIGDAGNDAEAIAACDLGIAIASDGSDELTQQVAGIVIHNQTLLPIASAFAISRQTVANINQNLAMNLIYNSAAIPAAAIFTLNPVICVALMITQACFTFLNVYRFKQQPLEHLQQQITEGVKEPSFEGSHAKITKHTPRSNNESTCIQEPSAPQKPLTSKSTAHPFWSSCISSISADNSSESMETKLPLTIAN
ncbi:heavy metal translocating P-type ATPase [Legionella longbeachae]|uniref:Putative cation transport ATPase n=1 Tax=Legionella longbeachae serogroup 1 (strain NSW150) TaxID=661367 RepID=D3HP75_LEGLN|nr:cation-translocating P-type ATPase [Legionella longbeachae]VEE01215.1 cation transport ATPase [Legionella oakridgensis]HBD7398346.1 cation-translocating P-type ATPase [Legionella pneumophila]ARB92415.1 heavy metal translocating P-type ATPase [Legionella longbeachae]ARM34405.1 cation-translocating P-type ATPase [Legionella longbeachae]EEZ96308.1 heavy metal translocating P-type ATPase-like protein [Legionella longbeachae D-4968]